MNDTNAPKGTEANPLTNADSAADVAGLPRPLPPAIPPTVGRKVWFRPNGAQTLNGATFENYASQPMDATIVCVWGDRMVNLQVIDHGGIGHGVRSVPLRQPGEPAPAGFYCEWMPFQVGQAKALADVGTTISTSKKA